MLRACDADRARRYASADQLRADMELLQRGQSVRRARSRARWARRGVTLAAVVVVLAALLAMILPRLGQTPRATSGDGPPLTNDAANALCAKALLVLRGDNYAQFAEAYTNLHRAIALDSNFARPYVGLFELRVREMVPSLGATSREELHSIVRKLKELELAPGLGVTLCAQSLAQYWDWEYPEALELARRSVEADPDYELSRLSYNFILTHLGWPLEGRRHAEIARKLAPSKAHVYRSLGHTYYMQRDYTNAMALYRQAIGWQSHHTTAHHWTGRACLALGDYLQAIAYFEQRDLLRGDDEAETKASYDPAACFSRRGPPWLLAGNDGDARSGRQMGTIIRRPWFSFTSATPTRPSAG